MRQIFIITVCFLAFLGCSKNHKRIAQENIENHLKTVMNDPSSYEFVTMTKLDTIYKVPYYKERVKDYEKFVERIGFSLERKKEALKITLSDSKKGNATISQMKYQVEESQKFLDRNVKELYAYKELLESSNKEDIKEVKTIFTIRENNENGVKVINKYYVSLNENLSFQTLN